MLGFEWESGKSYVLFGVAAWRIGFQGSTVRLKRRLIGRPHIDAHARRSTALSMHRVGSVEASFARVVCWEIGYLTLGEKFASDCDVFNITRRALISKKGPLFTFSFGDSLNDTHKVLTLVKM